MFVTKDEAPAEFMQRYKRIMDGKEKLDTIAKLKEFWLFMIAQGKDQNYEVRAAMADMAFNVTPGIIAYTTDAVKWVYIELESYRVITAEEHEDPEEYKRISDTGWRSLEHFINRIKVPHKN